MNRNSINVGKKIKCYRKAQKYTLKTLAEKTGLSIGFLSQLERGMTTIAIDSLFNLANVLDVDIMDFFDGDSKNCDDPVVHGYNKPILQSTPDMVQFYLSGLQDHDFKIVPKLLHLMPSQRYIMPPGSKIEDDHLQDELDQELQSSPVQEAQDSEELKLLPPCGDQKFYKNREEEFVYVLEGILSLEMDHKLYTLYPEDSIQIVPGKRHCWSNRSNRIARMLLVTVSGSASNAQIKQ